jgi:hypothetical protein
MSGPILDALFIASLLRTEPFVAPATFKYLFSSSNLPAGWCSLSSIYSTSIWYGRLIDTSTIDLSPLLTSFPFSTNFGSLVSDECRTSSPREKMCLSVSIWMFLRFIPEVFPELFSILSSLLLRWKVLAIDIKMIIMMMILTYCIAERPSHRCYLPWQCHNDIWVQPLHRWNTQSSKDQPSLALPSRPSIGSPASSKAMISWQHQCCPLLRPSQRCLFHWWAYSLARVVVHRHPAPLCLRIGPLSQAVALSCHSKIEYLSFLGLLSSKTGHLFRLSRTQHPTARSCNWKKSLVDSTFPGWTADYVVFASVYLVQYKRNDGKSNYFNIYYNFEWIYSSMFWIELNSFFEFELI